MKTTWKCTGSFPPPRPPKWTVMICSLPSSGCFASRFQHRFSPSKRMQSLSSEVNLPLPVSCLLLSPLPGALSAASEGSRAGRREPAGCAAQARSALSRAGQPDPGRPGRPRPAVPRGLAGHVRPRHPACFRGAALPARPAGPASCRVGEWPGIARRR